MSFKKEMHKPFCLVLKPFKNIWSLIQKEWFKFKYEIKSLFYNHFLDIDYVGDISMEPILWFVDNFTKLLGPFFIVAVTSLTAAVVLICYIIGLPYWWRKSPTTTIFLLIFGNWVLINIIFNYFMGCYVKPGLPPKSALIPVAVSICKKCISPKPPRTHHCSVCNTCILKMDHHCPWLNNCVGFYNHRYFFMYMAYMVLGVLFLIIFGVEIAYYSVILEKLLDNIYEEEEDEEELIGHPVRFNNSVMIPITDYDNKSWDSKKWERSCIMFAALMCAGVLIALGSLFVWHLKLISRGETSIEGRINKVEALKYAKQNKVYVNPYDLGWKNNWKIFLGLNEGRNWLHIIFPSTHKPSGDGLIWRTTYSEEEKFYNEKNSLLNLPENFVTDIPDQYARRFKKY